MSQELSRWKILAFENFAKSYIGSQETNVSDVRSSQSRLRCDRKIRALKPHSIIGYQRKPCSRYYVKDILKLAREVSREVHQGAKEGKWAGLRRSGEGQARLGTTDVFLRVYYVTDFHFFLSSPNVTIFERKWSLDIFSILFFREISL